MLKTVKSLTCSFARASPSHCGGEHPTYLLMIPLHKLSDLGRREGAFFTVRSEAGAKEETTRMAEALRDVFRNVTSETLRYSADFAPGANINQV